MSNPIVVVTGASGQLGKELKVFSDFFPSFQFIFLSKEDLPVENTAVVSNYFQKVKPQYCINCAAYTAVDKAETDREKAFLVNAKAVGTLAAVCRRFNTRFLHISTDYVFDGSSPQPYTEESATKPVSVYGESKLKGEELCFANDPDAIIVRTAWLYSEFGHNFVKTMLRLMKEKSSINVVNDQVGSPTYAADLAKALLQILASGKWQPGIYHYSNQGKISWYELAVAIKGYTKSACAVHPITTDQYPVAARRPAFSLLNTRKIEETYGIEIPGWKRSLHQCLQHLQNIT